MKNRVFIIILVHRKKEIIFQQNFFKRRASGQMDSKQCYQNLNVNTTGESLKQESRGHPQKEEHSKQTT